MLEFSLKHLIDMYFRLKLKTKQHETCFDEICGFWLWSALIFQHLKTFHLSPLAPTPPQDPLILTSRPCHLRQYVHHPPWSAPVWLFQRKNTDETKCLEQLGSVDVNYAGKNSKADTVYKCIIYIYTVCMYIYFKLMIWSIAARIILI